jgi:outer membrane protein OmpA-like peptidoglycan-associated protein
MRILIFSVLFLLFGQSAPAQSPDIFLKAIQSAEVYFDFGKHDLKPAADSALAPLIQLCRERENSLVRITAHTDSIGSGSNNLALSERRATSVKKYLLENGVAAAKFELSYFGEKKPVSSNRTDAGRQKNRHATVEVLIPVPMTTIEGNVRDPRSGKGVEAGVVVHTKETRDSMRTDTTGHFEATVPVGAIVGVDVLAGGYFFETKMLRALPGKMPLLVIELQPAIPGESADIQNLYFVGNQAVLLKKSEPSLPQVLRFMQINKNVKVEIAGHVNYPNAPPRPKTTFEYRLSVARAKMVYDYLLENGISTDRIRYQGYSNWKMRYPKARNEAEQSLNRRVEIRILPDEEK